MPARRCSGISRSDIPLIDGVKATATFAPAFTKSSALPRSSRLRSVPRISASSGYLLDERDSLHVPGAAAGLVTRLPEPFPDTFVSQIGDPVNSPGTEISLYCSSCGVQLEEQLAYCHQCGRPTHPDRTSPWGGPRDSRGRFGIRKSAASVPDLPGISKWMSR